MASSVKDSNSSALSIPSYPQGWAALPNDLLEKVLEFIPDFNTLTNAHLVCKGWRSIEPVGENLKVINLKVGSVNKEVSNPQHRVTKDASEVLQESLDRIKGKGFKFASIQFTNGGFNQQCFDILKKLPVTHDGLQVVKLDLSNDKSLDIYSSHLEQISCLPLNALNLSRAGMSFGVMGGGMWYSINNSGFGYLKGLPLTTLDLSHSPGVTGDDLGDLEGLPLTSLNVEGCEGTHFKDLTLLRGLFPSHLLNYNADSHAELINGIIDKMDAFHGKKIGQALDYYIYRLSDSPKGGDNWGRLHRYCDGSLFKTALGLASAPTDDKDIQTVSRVLEAMDGLSSPPTTGQKSEIIRFVNKLSFKNRLKLKYYALSNGDRNGNALHRLDQVWALKRALKKVLKEIYTPNLNNLRFKEDPMIAITRPSDEQIASNKKVHKSYWKERERTKARAVEWI